VTNPGLTFEKTVASSLWKLPSHVAIQDGCVVAAVDQVWSDVGPQPGMLNEFVHLSEGDDQQIAAYARKHGLLNVCDEHLLPSIHRIWSRPLPGASSSRECDVAAFQRLETFVTPTSVWRYWARSARAILRIAARLDRDRLGDLADWRAISDEGLEDWREEILSHMASSVFLRRAIDAAAVPQGTQYGQSLILDAESGTDELDELAGGDLSLEEELESDRIDLGIAISAWLRMAAITIDVRWLERRPNVSLIGAPLFGALGVQLMLALTRSDGLAICTSCGEPYVPKRRPSRSRRNYCGSCGRTAAIRDAAREFRRRRLEE
jgi:hypothetical protein